ncbi:MAG: class I SAM-dependent methyltransferase [Gemmatimonadales bacterium]|nr:class I SAM-dependent methyltransferase [Gemmatimonadales bacterium]
MTVTALAASPGSPPEGNSPASGVGGMPLVLVPSQCFVCNDDEAEPVAVGQDFDCSSSPDTFLAVRCPRCGLIYLNPAPAPGGSESTRRHGRVPGREIARFCQRLGGSARVLHVNGVEDLEHPRDAYDAVILTNLIERVDDPLSALEATRQLLSPGGMALIITPNTMGTVCRVYQGRHWSGYNFPRHRNLFCAEALTRATRMAGLEIVSLATAGAPEAWVLSLRNTLADWRLPHWALAALERGWGTAIIPATAVEWWQQLRGKGGLLLATVRRPAE